MDRKKVAIAKKYEEGYNCSQAVACSFSDLMGMEEKQMFQVMSGFGVGMGGMRGNCGAVIAGVAVIGMMMKGGDTRQKGKILKAAKEYTRRFEERNKSLICREIKGIDTGKMTRSCDGCIEDAVEILEQMIEEGLLEQ